MAVSIRKLGKRFFITANVVICLVFAAACLQPWLPPERFWIIGFMSILLPYLLLLVAAFIPFWLLFDWRWALLSAGALALGYRAVDVLFNLHREPVQTEKSPGSMRVLSWNIRSFNGPPGKSNRVANTEQIFETIRRWQPDVVCFQEYGQYEAPDLGRDYSQTMRKMGYDAQLLSRDYSRKTYSYSSGTAIFSKYPIAATFRLPFTSSPESVVYADIVVGKDTIRVFNTHLQSYKLNEDELEQVERVKRKEKPSYVVSTSLLGKMKRAFRNRGAQADQVRALLDSARHPLLLCLDMNDVPNSYSYWQLRGRRNDAFLEKGYGLGRTFISLAPTLRIDYIFADPRLPVRQFAVLPERLSDHLALVADLAMPSASD